MIKTIPLLLVMLFVFSACGSNKNFRARANQTNYQYTEDDTLAEIRFGRNLAARILGKQKTWSNDKAVNYIRTLGTGLAAEMGRPDLHFYFAVLDTPEINAYGIPGGYIFITRGALELIENEAQLIGVLAHEIAHVNQRHIVNKIKLRGKDNAFLASVATVAGGGAGAGIEVFNKMLNEAMNMLFGGGLDHEMELQADREGIQIVAALKYDWTSYLDFLQKIDSQRYQEHREVYNSTHPPISERLKTLSSIASAEFLKGEEGKRHEKRFYENIHF